MAKRLVMFNHKGGVSKTTTVYNVGWKLADMGRKVLLVDADPQCNLSSLILGDQFDEYYINAQTRTQNIKDGVTAAFRGTPTPIAAVSCNQPAAQPNMHLLAGHATLSEYDASLTFAQSTNALATLQNLPGAFNELMKQVENNLQIDYTLIDLNPGLSAINQNIFLNSDYFVIPTNPDPFSIMALETLQSILPRWANWKVSSAGNFTDSAYPLRPGLPKLLGTLVQRFNIRNGRAAAPYRDNIAEIKEVTINRLLPAMLQSSLALPSYPQHLLETSLCLAEIPDFGALLPRAHEAHVPVFALKDEELHYTGPVLDAMRKKRDELNAQFAGMANVLEQLMA